MGDKERWTPLVQKEPTVHRGTCWDDSLGNPTHSLDLLCWFAGVIRHTLKGNIGVSRRKQQKIKPNQKPFWIWGPVWLPRSNTHTASLDWWSNQHPCLWSQTTVGLITSFVSEESLQNSSLGLLIQPEPSSFPGYSPKYQDKFSNWKSSHFKRIN